MRLKFLSFSNLTLLVALSLSTVAAYYSIIGLTAIFAGAVIPVIIMGSILEVGKITTTVWLRKYWSRASWVLKLYLVPAVVALALLTSMGIFGFLSKAHMEQGVTSGDAQGKVAIYDEKIKTAKDNIDANRKALKQLDEAVDQVMGRSTSEQGADKAVQIRRSQASDRKRLLAEIQEEQKTVSKLSEERAPLASELRKVEAEVGPIKYIAALIYGDNADQNMLESAVRWVIILLVTVFDPLAIALVLAANASKGWDDEEYEEYKPDTWVAEVGEKPTQEEKAEYEEDDAPITDDQLEQIKDSVSENLDNTTESVFDKHPYLTQPFSHFNSIKPMVSKSPEEPSDIELETCYKCGTPLINAPGIGPFCPNKECDVLDNTSGESITWTYIPPAPIEPEVDTIETVGTTIERPYQDLEGGYVVFDGKHMHKEVLKNVRPDLLKLVADNARQSNTNFGTEFPRMADKGDTFVRVDVLPNKVYKFDGTRWISVNKDQATSYLHDQEYIKYLVEKIDAGEYDVDLLSDSENQQIEEYLTKKS